MDFGALPPEITSARMYAGPGAEPMLAAAAAWDGLAAELQSTATSYGSVVSGLTGGAWTGPSSAAMAAAAEPYVAWMSATGAQAKEASVAAAAAAGAYQTAFAATVPPPVVAANRSQLASLVATNIFGQNTAAIAATEAEYGEMWAQDAAAMFDYAGSSATAVQLTPFTAAPQTTSAPGVASQATAVTQAAAATGTQSAVSSGVGVVPQLLQQLATASSSYPTNLGNILNTLTGNSSTGSVYSNIFSIAANISKGSTVANVGMSVPNLGMVQSKALLLPLSPLSHEIPKSALGGGLGLRSAVSGGLVRAVSAGVGDASLVGALSVPPSWAAATPAIRLAATAIPTASLAAAPATAIPGSLLSQMALGSLTGGALGGSVPRVVSGSGIRSGAARMESNAPVKLDTLIAQLQRQPEAVQHWNVDQAGLDGLLAELSKKPGIHAVHLSADGKTKPTLPKSQMG